MAGSGSAARTCCRPNKTKQRKMYVPGGGGVEPVLSSAHGHPSLADTFLGGEAVVADAASFGFAVRVSARGHCALRHLDRS